MKKIRFAILGCGVIGDVHARAIAELPELCELVALCDVNPARAEEYAKKYNVKAYSDYAEMLRDGEIDAVSICTPSGMHADQAIAAIEAGKHVLCEKPMALTTADAERIREAEARSDKKLSVIFQMRYTEDIQYLKRVIEDGTLGQLTFCDLYMKYWRDESYFKVSPWRGTFKMDGGGALMNQGVHGIDVISYLCGKIKPKSCQSLVRTIVHDIEVEDTAVAICEFESGALGIITGMTSVYPGFSREIEICGSAGTLIIRDGQIERLVIKEDGIDETYDVTEGEGKKDASAVPTKWHKLKITRFIKAIRGEDVPDLCYQHQGKIAVELIKRIYENSI